MGEPLQDFRGAILAGVGHAPEVIEPGRFLRFATSDRRGDDSGWCKVFDDMRGGVFGCYRQGISETWSATEREAMTREQRVHLSRLVMTATKERQAAQRDQWAANAQRIAQMWSQSVPLVAGDPVTLYLKRRGIAGVWPLPASLRLHRGLPYWDGADKLGTFPALVAPLIAPDGRMVALHRTYLTADGRKAAVPSPKKLTGTAGPLTGAGIPLHKPAHGCIGVAEGIETALAAWCASGVPTVATYCAGSLAVWRWPAGAQRVMVFADADKAGREAADSLRRRVLKARLRCDVLTPTADGADWCDVWAERDAVHVQVRGAA